MIESSEVAGLKAAARLGYISTHMLPDEKYGGVAAVASATWGHLRKLFPDAVAMCVSTKPGDVESFNYPRTSCSESVLAHRWGFSMDVLLRFWCEIPKCDVVIVNGITAFPVVIAAWLCRWHGIPYVICPHGGLLPERMAFRSLRKWLCYYVADRGNLRSSIAVHVTSVSEKEAVSSLNLGPPLLEVPNGVDLPSDDDLRRPAAVAGERRRGLQVLYLGRVHPSKGLRELIEAWRVVKDKYASDLVELVIAGPEDASGYVKLLQAAAERLDVAQSIRFVGAKYGADKRDVYSDADIVVSASPAENFGIAIAEGMAWGKPVVATTGTPWEVLNEIDAGRCVPPVAGAVGCALVEVLSFTSERRREMGERGRSFVRREMSWQSVAEELARSIEGMSADHQLQGGRKSRIR